MSAREFHNALDGTPKKIALENGVAMKAGGQ